MNKTELQNELSKLDKEISSLEKKKEKIVKQLLKCKDLTLKERFQHWINNCDEEHSWYLQPHTWPIADRILNGRELRRYQTYDVVNLFEDELYLVLGDEAEVADMLKDGEIEQADIDEAIGLAEELIKGNCISFTYDW